MIGPIKEYPLGWYEDMEFSFRMHRAGYKQAIAHDSYVNHACSSTVNSICDLDFRNKKIFESNYDKMITDVMGQEIKK